MSFLKKPSVELKKVTWPNKEKLVKLTFFIIITIIIITTYISFVDVFCTKLFYFLKSGVN